MFTIHKNLAFFCNTFPHLSSEKKLIKRNELSLSLAKKKDIPEISTSSEEKPIFPTKLSGGRILVQSAIGVFALGFIDAGYSGDWSRIGVISRQVEYFLKAAAFIVVPLCFFLIFSLFKGDGIED
ncbi:uncharacterized protein [Primulina eburnea]|uniref:uncharacterized protein n=1 Tax=Primulina eburnea TaxID=1245227 RepID=UPI003C6BDD2F